MKKLLLLLFLVGCSEPVPKIIYVEKESRLFQSVNYYWSFSSVEKGEFQIYYRLVSADFAKGFVSYTGELVYPYIDSICAWKRHATIPIVWRENVYGFQIVLFAYKNGSFDRASLKNNFLAIRGGKEIKLKFYNERDSVVTDIRPNEILTSQVIPF